MRKCMLNKMSIFICIIVYPLLAMEAPQPPQTIKMTTSQASFDIPLQVALQSQTIAHMLQDMPGQNIIIPLPDSINPKTLAMVIQVMTSFYNHRNLKGKALLDAVENDLNGVYGRIRDAYRTLLYALRSNSSLYPDQQKNDMVDLLKAFDFLDFNLGLQFAGRWIARAMMYDPNFEETIIHSGTSLSPYATREIARFYSLLNRSEGETKTLQEKRNTQPMGVSPLPGFENKDYGYSIQDLLDYDSPHFSFFIRKAAKGKLATRGLWSLNGLSLIPGIQAVKRLDLSFNKLHSLLDRNIFTGFTNLEALDLHANDLEIIDPLVFRPLMNLKMLDLRSNNLSEMNKKQLREALPNVNIMY